MRGRRPMRLDDEARVIAALALINAHVGKPCPTRREISEGTLVPRRHLWSFLNRLRARGLIEIEEEGARPPVRLRMRVAGGPWTEWTHRVRVQEAMAARRAAAGATTTTTTTTNATKE